MALNLKGEKGNTMEELETQTENTTDVEESDSLAEILGEVEPRERPEPAVEQEPEAKAEPVAAANDVETPAVTESDELSEETVAALPKAEQGQYKAMKSERGKRKTAEALNLTQSQQIETLTGQVQQLMGMIQKPQPAPAAQETAAEEAKSFWDDPEAFIAKSLEGVTGKLTEGQQQTQRDRLTLFENAANLRHEDFGAVNKVFMDALYAHPNKEEAENMRLAIVNSADPAEAAYQQGLKIRSQAEIAEAGGMDALIAKRVAEGLAAQTATQESTEAEAALQSVTLPTPMAGRRSAGNAARPLEGFEADQSLGEILGNR